MKSTRILGILAFGLLVVDLLIKKAAVAVDPSVYLGPFGFDLVMHLPQIAGVTADFSTTMTTILMSTFTGFLLCLLAVAFFVYPPNLYMFKFGFSIVAVGMIGGLLDHLLYGTAIRYFTIKSGYNVVFSMSLSDVLTLSGFVLYIYALVKYKDELLPANKFRKRMWINPDFQRRYTIWIMGMGLCYSVVLGAFIASFLWGVLKLNPDMDPILRGRAFAVFGFSFLSLSLIQLMILFLFSKHITHNVAGPIFAFNRYVRKILDGSLKEDEKLILRDKDEFKELEELAELIEKRVK